MITGRWKGSGSKPCSAGDTEREAELGREPTKHLVVASAALAHRGKKTDPSESNRRIAEAAEYGRLKRKKQGIDRSIL